MEINAAQTIAYLLKEIDKLRGEIMFLRTERIVHMTTIQDLVESNLELRGKLNDKQVKTKDKNNQVFKRTQNDNYNGSDGEARNSETGIEDIRPTPGWLSDLFKEM